MNTIEVIVGLAASALSAGALVRWIRHHEKPRPRAQERLTSRVDRVEQHAEKLFEKFPELSGKTTITINGKPMDALVTEAFEQRMEKRYRSEIDALHKRVQELEQEYEDLRSRILSRHSDRSETQSIGYRESAKPREPEFVPQVQGEGLPKSWWAQLWCRHRWVPYVRYVTGQEWSQCALCGRGRDERGRRMKLVKYEPGVELRLS